MKKYLFLAILLCCQMVEATIILVDSNQDTLTNDGNCTLKEALLAANLNVAVDQCPAGQTFPTQDVIELLPNVLNDAIELGFQYPIIEGVSIIGPGSDKLVLYPSVNNTGHIFQINTTGQNVVSLSGFRIGGARSSAIDVVATDELIIDDVKFINNSAGTSSSGGAINAYNSGGWIRVYNSEFINNQAGEKGGAIYANLYSVDVQNSYFTNNTALYGGAVYAYTGSRVGEYTFIIKGSQFVTNQNTLEVIESYISIQESIFIHNDGNHVLLSKFNRGIINNSMFTENSSSRTLWLNDNDTTSVLMNTFLNNQGSDLYVTLNSGSQISGNIFKTTSGCLLDGTSSFNSLSKNNIDTGDSCAPNTSTNYLNTEPYLLPIGFYGGNQLIAPPSAQSPAIDAAVDTNTYNFCNNNDLSGIGRPHDGNGDGTSECDIGAVELPEDFDFIFINGFE
ncbi:MAG TPA: choice-of-anchor Q domain-containing protein [Gammaproteobacteria bacterium]|nr:hypothetical protein [Xanthomonadales bacterium]MCB1594547.1 hypothetical protein [Xanthomonadales bacterium]HOP21777.1 choice-of-anchor Q domain-containing protein [Gammaproteobacteria bacterium]HPI95198.1 choice-of-anchor Q domain-containing protein [Gammaproteobacteria bacterium]HPQ87380.1 choice-of-anchor Q domain-containing protein [Gammaproteobacteria bacterium]